MKAAPPVAQFHRTVETVEANVNFDVRSIANEDGSCRMCQVDLPNQEGPRGRHCRALLLPGHVDELIWALTGLPGAAMSGKDFR